MWKKEVFLEKEITLKESELYDLLMIMYCVGAADKEGNKFISKDNIKEWIESNSPSERLQNEAKFIMRKSDKNRTQEEKKLDDIIYRINLLLKSQEKLEAKVYEHERRIINISGMVYDV